VVGWVDGDGESGHRADLWNGRNRGDGRWGYVKRKTHPRACGAGWPQPSLEVYRSEDPVLDGPKIRMRKSESSFLA